MPQPYVILTTAASLDGRRDIEHPMLLYNRLEEYRVQELRGTVDAVITSAARMIKDDPEFPVKEFMGLPAVVVVDKNIDTPHEARLFKNKSRKVILVTSKRSNKGRLKRIQEVKPDLAVMEFGEHAVNLEDMLWELHRAGIRRMLLEGDGGLNMRMLNHGIVDELYLLVSPVILGQPYLDVFEGKLDRNVGLQLEGILQYGDHVVLHYVTVKKHR